MPQTPMTADATVAAWLAHPRGGAIIRELLSQHGLSEAVLLPFHGLPLQQLVTLTQGRVPQAAVDALVFHANGGTTDVP